MQTTILFVDDEPDLEILIRQKFRKELRSGTVAFEFAGNGREALAKIDVRSEGFDLIITDLNMPEMDGLELLTELGKRDLFSVVVVLSAYGDLVNIRTAMNRGAFDFLTKPIDFRDLEITRDKALRHMISLREKVRLQQDKSRLEERARFVRETFGRYLSDSVVQTLLDAPDGLRLGGEKRELTVLMSDLRGFTALSERLPPEEIVAMLNLYFGAMTEIVMDHGGTIDELLGDAMLVIFGAPLHQEDHAERAVASALAMQAAMVEVNRQNETRGLPTLQMGIGINTGEAVVGNIGSALRSKYGVVGSTVNLTARIEGLTRGHQVLISAATLHSCGLELDIRGVIRFEAKGFGEPIEVHDLGGLVGGPALPEPGPKRSQAGGQAEARPQLATPGASSSTIDSAQDHLATIGLMIAGVAHDIRNPLAFIINFADMTQELASEILAGLRGRIDPELAEELDEDFGSIEANLVKIAEHGARANELVSTMVETLRGTRGPAQEIDLNESISRHLELFESSMRVTNPELAWVIERELGEAVGCVRAAPQDISRIVLNLVQNAIDAAQGTGAAHRADDVARVVVATRDRGTSVEVRVRDNGIGIPEELHASIFEPFFTTKAKGEGLGLGLAFIRQLVHSLGGTITLESEEQRFTEFIVSLPRGSKTST